MFCKRCGKYVDDNEKVCPYCNGELNSATTTVIPPETQPAGYNNGDASSFGWALLGFLIPLLGLILYLVWKPEYPRRATSVGKGALISVIISVVSCIIMACVIGSVSCALLAGM